MDNKDKYFKGQQTNEEFVCFFRHHWIYLIRNFLYFISLLAIAVAVFGFWSEIQEILRGERTMKLFFLTGFLAFTFFFHRNFVRLLDYFVNVGIITNMRVINHKKTLFLRDTIDAIDMNQIQNIEQVQNGFLPNILGYGDLKIYLNASDTVMTFHQLPNIKFHFRCVSRQKEARQNELNYLRQIYEQRDNQRNALNQTVGFQPQVYPENKQS